MALAPRDVPITRDNVVVWYRNWKRTKHMTKKTWSEYLRWKIEGLDIEDREVNTEAMEGFSDTTHVVDMILADMKSYDPEYAEDENS
jgi:hypothetical protein